MGRLKDNWGGAGVYASEKWGRRKSRRKCDDLETEGGDGNPSRRRRTRGERERSTGSKETFGDVSDGPVRGRRRVRSDVGRPEEILTVIQRKTTKKVGRN